MDARRHGGGRRGIVGGRWKPCWSGRRAAVPEVSGGRWPNAGAPDSWTSPAIQAQDRMSCPEPASRDEPDAGPTLRRVIAADRIVADTALRARLFRGRHVVWLDVPGGPARRAAAVRTTGRSRDPRRSLVLHRPPPRGVRAVLRGRHPDRRLGLDRGDDRSDRSGIERAGRAAARSSSARYSTTGRSSSARASSGGVSPTSSAGWRCAVASS